MGEKTAFDKNTVFAIVVCLAILIGWQMYLEKKYPASVNPPAVQGVQKGERVLPQPVTPKAESTEAAATAAKAENAVKPEGKEQIETYEDSDWKITFSSYGGRISEIVLKKYTGADGKPIQLLTSQMPGYLLTDVQGTKEDPSFSKINYQVTRSSPTELLLTASNKGLEIKKKLTIVPEQYMVKVDTVISGALEGAKNVLVDLQQPAPSANQSSGGFLNIGHRGADIQEYYFAHGTKKSRDYVTSKEPVTKNYDQTQFAALGSRYFTSLLFNQGNVLPQGQAFLSGPNSTLRLSYPVLDTREPIVVDYTLYAGPKLLSALKKVGPEASSVVDFGTFSFIAKPILKLMQLLFRLLGNYGVAIIALTILVRGITYPFTYMSYKSMKAMQKIQPEIAKLKEIYKDNQVALNQEMMKLMRENKVNPMGGCLPMILQLPVFWALYQVLENSIELYHSPFVGWIHDLSVKDPFYILPILMGITMFIQQKMTPSTMDPSQAKVMLIMPVFFSLLMFNLPSGLTLYIFVSTLFGIIQQIPMMKERAAPAQAIMRKS